MAFRFNIVVRIYFALSIFAGHKPAMIHEINLWRRKSDGPVRDTRNELYRLHEREREGGGD